MAKNYLRFWGVRGSYPAPYASHMRVGGNTPCVELCVDGHTVILDAGTGIISLGQHLIKTASQRHVNVVLTHYHWDHISGLPFFVPAFVPGWEIDFYGPAADPEELEYHIAQQMKAPYFPVETETWLANIRYHTPQEDTFEIGPVKISSFTVFHPGRTYGYRIEWKGKTIVYAPDNELWFSHQTIEERKGDFDEDEQHLLELMQEENRLRGIEFMDGVDMLIHDAQYTPEDYLKKRGWGHSCYIDTVNSAIDAEVGELYLFGHDPSYDDDNLDEMHAEAKKIVDERQSQMGCLLAGEGVTIDLGD